MDKSVIPRGISCEADELLRRRAGAAPTAAPGAATAVAAAVVIPAAVAIPASEVSAAPFRNSRRLLLIAHPHCRRLRPPWCRARRTAWQTATRGHLRR